MRDAEGPEHRDPAVIVLNPARSVWAQNLAAMLVLPLGLLWALAFNGLDSLLLVALVGGPPFVLGWRSVRAMRQYGVVSVRSGELYATSSWVGTGRIVGSRSVDPSELEVSCGPDGKWTLTVGSGREIRLLPCAEPGDSAATATRNLRSLLWPATGDDSEKRRRRRRPKAPPT